ncbi:SRPBCC family protein [Roseibium sp.]|uniref:SRPBCC family protein n=1 Tax=Roseibium sp. TaxID=1936156 RepID=UPI003BB1B931
MADSPVPLIVRRHIRADRNKIFDAFASAETLTLWFTPSDEISVDALEYDFVPMGRFRLRYLMPEGREAVVAGTFEKIESPGQIVLSWIWQAPDPLAGIPMTVTFRFLAKDTGTDVVIIHEGIPSDTACTVHEDGWDATLIRLVVFLEKETNQ